MSDGYEHALDWIRFLQVIRFLGAEVVERQKCLRILDKAGHGGCVFDPVFFFE